MHFREGRVENGGVSDGDRLFRLFPTVCADVDEQCLCFGQNLCLIFLAKVNSFTPNNTDLCAETHAPAAQHALIDTADSLKLQITVICDTTDDKADLIHVGGKHDLFGGAVFAAQVTQNISQGIDRYLLFNGRRLQHGQDICSDLLLATGNTGQLAQRLQMFFHHMPYISSVINAAISVPTAATSRTSTTSIGVCIYRCGMEISALGVPFPATVTASASVPVLPPMTSV